MNVKITISVIFMSLLIPMIVFSKTPEDVFGYEKTKWGDSIETVKDYYTNLTKDFKNGEDFLYKNNDHDLSRIFTFNSNKQLCLVTIEYIKDSSDFWDLIKKKLINDFGDNYKERVVEKPVYPTQVVEWIFKSTAIELNFNKLYNIKTHEVMYYKTTLIFIPAEIKSKKEEVKY